jgi:integrase
MAKRRGHGEGSIYQRKDGRWVAVITIDETGKRKYYYGDTRQEVQEKLKAALADQQRGMLVTAKDQKLGDYMLGWLEDKKTQGIKASTAETYESIIRNHLLPGLGHISMQRLTPLHIHRFYLSLLRSGMSPQMLRQVHYRVLHPVLEQAMLLHIIPTNVSTAERLFLPKVEAFAHTSLSPEQAQLLLKTARDWQGTGHWIYPMLTLALLLGMRVGEITGLHWSDIDFKQGQLRIERTAYPVGGQIIETAPKTDLSKRTLILHPMALAALKEQRRWLEEQQAPNPLGLVFVRDSKHVRGEIIRENLNYLLNLAGIPHIRFHDLRHSTASILHSLGVDMKDIQVILGHSTIKLTSDVYTVVSLETQRQAMKKWDKLFEGE